MSERGLTLLELLFVIAIGVTLTAVAVPLLGSGLDSLKTMSAARYLEGRIMLARMEAIRRSRAVALRFQPFDGDYLYAAYSDGNRNGVRTADIVHGIDEPLGAAERLSDKYGGVRLELMAGVPEIAGSDAGTRDGLRIGAARILSMNPDGTSSSGTIYVRGRHTQYAVRVFGVTGRTRVLQYRSGEAAWISR
jgi:type II secretory pathway pseudopilin PulG